MLSKFMLAAIAFAVVYVYLRVIFISRSSFYDVQATKNQQYAVVSGATGGVGTALLAKLQETPIIIHRSGSTLPKGVRLHFEMDYDDFGEFYTGFEYFLRDNSIELAQITALYTLHGCGCFETFYSMSYNDCRRFLNANLFSHVALTNYFINKCPKIRRISAVSSLCAIFPAYFFYLYAGSKAFLEEFYTGLAQKYPHLHIVVARPPAIRQTRFMEQGDMKGIGNLGSFVNLKVFSVLPSAVAETLIRRSSGVYNIGWLVHAVELFKSVIGTNMFIALVGRMRIGRFIQ